LRSYVQRLSFLKAAEKALPVQRQAHKIIAVAQYIIQEKNPISQVVDKKGIKAVLKNEQQS